jgi:hypothetical protein
VRQQTRGSEIAASQFDQLRLYLPSSLLDEWQFDLAALAHFA